MPMFDFTCEVCGAERRAWRREGEPPRFCDRKCRSMGRVKGKRVKYVVTEEAHATIRRAYQGDTGNGQIRDLARSLGLPRWKVTRYAIEQGWMNRSSREPDWTERELGILERSAHRHPTVIQRHLRKAGFHRSETGIVLKRKRMRFLRNIDGHSATDVAECFGIDVHTVTRWISRGYMKAKRRETRRTAIQGGDIWYIKDEWIRDFVVNTVSEVDFRKVNKFWLVDLLAGGKDYLAPRRQDAEGER